MDTTTPASPQNLSASTGALFIVCLAIGLALIIVGSMAKVLIDDLEGRLKDKAGHEELEENMGTTQAGLWFIISAGIVITVLCAAGAGVALHRNRKAESATRRESGLL